MGKHDFNIKGKAFTIYNSADAWGDGEHETTAFMLEMIPKVSIKDKDILDIGTGSGILSVLCGKLGAKHILALDIKASSLEWARKNFKHNGIVAETEIGDCTVPIDETADIVLANLPPTEQYENVKYVREYVNDDGYLIMTWLRVIPFIMNGFEVIEHIEGKEYDGYILKKIA